MNSEAIESALRKGFKVFVVIDEKIETKFYKASLYGPNLNLSLIPMDEEEIIHEVRKHLKPAEEV